jgi:hypothetical protein
MKKQILKFKLLGLMGLLAMLASSCGDKSADISILATSDSFVQSEAVNNKVDILWIVDSSGSMAPYQANLAANFSTFINGFVTQGYDFNMAVAGTDAWVREYNYNGGTCNNNPNPSHNPNNTYTSSADCNPTTATFGDLTKLRDGDIYGTYSGGHTHPGTRSGTYLITSLMNPADIVSTFATDVKVGVRGDGIEAGFQSMRSVLRLNSDGTQGYGGETYGDLANFRRSSAFLAVIIVSDEEDQSTKDSASGFDDYDDFTNEYSPGYDTTEYTNAFVSFLDGYTGSTPGNRNYNVSAIYDTDINHCAGHDSSSATGYRYGAIVNATDGVAGSICDANFSDNLDEISHHIVELSTRFKLSQEPDPSTISILVNSVSIPNSPTNGWTLVDDNNVFYIVFHGTAVPPQGASISVNFTPLHLH